MEKVSALSLAADCKYGEIKDEQIQELAGLVAVSDRVASTAGDTYLRTLVLRLQTYQRDSRATDLAALEIVEAPMYEAVKRGSLTSDIVYNPLVDTNVVRAKKAKEHNRRCNWARSIKSELKGALKAGVVLDSIPMQLVTKKYLRDRKTEAVEATAGMPSRSKLTHSMRAAMSIAQAAGYIDKAAKAGENLGPVETCITILTTRINAAKKETK